MTPSKKAGGDDGTRERIVRAALQTLREEGFAGTTARAIARHGDFNQALIFYHFGSVSSLLLEAFQRLSEDQVAKYRAAAADVRSPSDLVEIARRLHEEDLDSGSVNAVTQLMAASVSDPGIGRTVLDRFEAWIGIVEDALARAIEGNPYAAFVPVREAAYAICAMFLGIELMSRLDPERSEADAIFDMMGVVATLAEEIMSSTPPTEAGTPEP